MDEDTFQVVTNKEEQAITSIENFGTYIDTDEELSTVRPPFKKSPNSLKLAKKTIPSVLKKRGDKAYKSSDLNSAVKNYSEAILSIRYLLRQGLIDMMSLNQSMLLPVIVPCNLNLALCYLKLSEALILSDSKDLLKDEFLLKCIRVCEDVIKLWDMQKTQKLVKGKKQLTKIKVAKAYVRKGKALEMLGRISEATECFNRVLKMDPGNALAKEALLKIGAKKEASTSPIFNVHNEDFSELKNRDLFRNSEQNTVSAETERIDNSLLNRNGNLTTGSIPLNLNNQETANLEELQGLKGAIILVFRIIFDIIGGLLGYGTISPTYYNYM